MLWQVGAAHQLREIFWQMNEISSRTESKTEAASESASNGKKSSSEVQQTTVKTYLYITSTHKTPDEMADMYNFSDDQRVQLSELMSDENDSIWGGVLSEIQTGAIRCSNCCRSTI